MTTLNVRIDDELDRRLAKLARSQHRSKSDLVRDMLWRQTKFDELKQLRERLRPYAEAAGYLTDEDFLQIDS